MIVKCQMWNLTPDYLQQVKEELKGRCAAIKARMAHELVDIASDLEELEKLESMAYSVAVKHLPEPKSADCSQEPAAEAVSLAPASAEQAPAGPAKEFEPEAKPASGLVY